MPGRIIKPDDKNSAVKDFQNAVNSRAESRFYPPLVVDSDFGPTTLRAFQDLGYALGFMQKTLAKREISVAVQAMFNDPSLRKPEQLQRARERAPKLHERTIGFDGSPIFWGLAKPLVRAREHGWGGSLVAADRRPGVPERFGKKSQAALYKCSQAFIKTGRCPGNCGGDCNPANPPGFSSHELRSDGSAGFGGRKAGAKLAWWELGLDLDDSDSAMAHLKALGYKIHRTYPGSKKEFHHLNFTANPGRVLPPTGPNAKPAKKPKIKHAKTTGRLKGIDVSLNEPSIDWKVVSRAGNAFAWAKVSDGLGTPDTKFGKARWSKMHESGIARGGYHFARPQPGRDPRDEVHEFLRLLKAAGGLKDGDLIPMLDVEKYGKKGKLSPRATSEWIHGFVTEMHAQIGRRPIIYTGSFWRDDMGNPGDNFGCRLWLAAYVKHPDPFVPTAWSDSGWTIWQRSETGTVPGIDGVKCDLNVMKGGAAMLERLRM